MTGCTPGFLGRPRSKYLQYSSRLGLSSCGALATAFEAILRDFKYIKLRVKF
jgi:hypothetical protein